MRKATVLTISLIIVALMIASASAISFPSGLSSMSTPTMTSSLGSTGMPANNLQVSTPSTAFGNNGWSLNNMKFFQPSRATPSTTGTGAGISSGDMGAIMNLLGNAATTDQAQQAAATPTATPTPAFNSVSGEIPADQVLFLEVSKNVVYVDASSQGFKVPAVTMNYQYDDTNKKLILKNKNGTDVSGAKIIVGYSRQNDVDGTYLFDYNIGSIPYDDIPIVYTGADGRASIMLNGTQKDLLPGEKAEVTTQSGNLMTTITVTNFGLVPRSNIELKDKM